MSTKKEAEIKKLAEDAFAHEGWGTLLEQAKAIPKYMQSCRTAILSKTGRIIWVKYPRMEIRMKSKMGRIDTVAYPNKEDMDKIQKRVDPKAFEEFQNRMSNTYAGAAMAIEAMSLVTCQATGKSGAKSFRESGGWVRTLLPSVIRTLNLKEMPLGSHV